MNALKDDGRLLSLASWPVYTNQLRGIVAVVDPQADATGRVIESFTDAMCTRAMERDVLSDGGYLLPLRQVTFDH